MEEVSWKNLEKGEEYYIQQVLGPNPSLRSIQNSDGVPYGQKKIGRFVGIETDYGGANFVRFSDLRNPHRDIEVPYLPSALGTTENNIFSVLNTTFYKPVDSEVLEKRYYAKKALDVIDEKTNTDVGNLLREWFGGKKTRTKKSKRTNKGKKSKKNRRTNKRR